MIIHNDSSSSSTSCLDFYSSEQKKDNQPFQRHSCLVHLQSLQPSEENINEDFGTFISISTAET